jgi:hypothetical protein
VAVPPSEIVVPLIVIELFVNDALAMLEIVLFEPLIVLLSNVSVVTRPTKVSALVGNVSVPVLVIVLMLGAVSVLLVSVCVPVKLTASVIPYPLILVGNAVMLLNARLVMGIDMFDVPSKLMPLIVRAVNNLVAVAALPVDISKGIVMLAVPSNCTPLMVLTVASFVAVAAVPANT